MSNLRKLDIGLANVPELAADRVLWRGLIRDVTWLSSVLELLVLF